MDRIDSPKVFISYAWGSQDYQMKVLAFATTLASDGIEVLLDKWEINAGNDMNNFMERSVSDPTVTNVIILLDENYAKKANSRSGGVGTETQIISQQVYSSVDQTKFIPVIFERNSNGEICKPNYLQSRFHFDLSLEETYDKEYQNLVRALFGVNSYKKPETGVRPAWIDEQITASPKAMASYDLLKENRPEVVKEEMLFSYLQAIEKRIIEYASKDNKANKGLEEYLDAYASNRAIRKDYLLLVEKSSFCTNRSELIGDFFERVQNSLEEKSNIGSELSKVFLHELFLYTIAVLMKKGSYKELGYLLGRTYFSSRPRYDHAEGDSYNLFYSGPNRNKLDEAVKARDGQNYYSGTAHYWTSTIDLDFCSKEDFVSADLLCYNYAIYGNGYLDNWKWFPITYIYVNNYSNFISKLGRQLISKEKLKKVLLIFNYDSIESFIAKFKEVETAIQDGEYRDYRYNMTFQSAPKLGEFIKASQIGVVR